MYGNTTKPSLTSISAAASVSIGSGSKYFGSGVSSSFTHGSSPAALAILASRTASAAVRAPDVFGNISGASGQAPKAHCLYQVSISLHVATHTVTISASDATRVL